MKGERDHSSLRETQREERWRERERERERERKKEDEGGASGLRGGAAGSGDNGSLPRMAFGHYSPLSESHCHRHQCSVSPPMGLFFDGCEFSSLSLLFFLFPSKFQLIFASQFSKKGACDAVQSLVM